MSSTINRFPDSVERRPWVAFVLIVGVTCGPAFNLTVAEWIDAVDDKDTTAWQSELVIDAWADAIRTIGICVYAYLTRSGTAAKRRRVRD